MSNPEVERNEELCEDNNVRDLSVWNSEVPYQYQGRLTSTEGLEPGTRIEELYYDPEEHGWVNQGVAEVVALDKTVVNLEGGVQELRDDPGWMVISKGGRLCERSQFDEGLVPDERGNWSNIRYVRLAVSGEE